MDRYEKMKMMLEEMSRAGRWKEWGEVGELIPPPTPSSESKKIADLYEENIKLKKQIEELNEKLKVMSTVDLYEENIKLKKEIKKLKSDISWDDVGRTYPVTFK
jgi:peptidoglycan hydrolase CwlO-like protein